METNHLHFFCISNVKREFSFCPKFATCRGNSLADDSMKTINLTSSNQISVVILLVYHYNLYFLIFWFPFIFHASGIISNLTVTHYLELHSSLVLFINLLNFVLKEHLQFTAFRKLVKDLKHRNVSLKLVCNINPPTWETILDNFLMNKEETYSSIFLILQSDIANTLDGINEQLGRKVKKKRNWEGTCIEEKSFISTEDTFIEKSPSKGQWSKSSRQTSTSARSCYLQIGLSRARVQVVKT